MGNTPPAPAFSNPNEVSLTVYDPGCCGAQYSLPSSRAPDPRLLAFVTADEYAKKLKALDEMFVAQSVPLGRGLIFYVSSILLMPTVKYLAISMSVFLTYFLLVGQKGGMVFMFDF